jgi:hypothetical protein
MLKSSGSSYLISGRSEKYDLTVLCLKKMRKSRHPDMCLKTHPRHDIGSLIHLCAWGHRNRLIRLTDSGIVPHHAREINKVNFKPKFEN